MVDREHDQRSGADDEMMDAVVADKVSRLFGAITSAADDEMCELVGLVVVDARSRVVLTNPIGQELLASFTPAMSVRDELMALVASMRAQKTPTLMCELRLDVDDESETVYQAFASQVLACLRQLGLADDAEHVNPNGGAIALGHPLGMSGTRLALTAAHQMVKQGGKRALATMCVGVGQGVSLAIERV